MVTILAPMRLSKSPQWFYSLLIAVILVGAAAQITIEQAPDWSEGGPLRPAALIALACGLASDRPIVQSAVTLVLVAVVAIGGALVSVELM